MRRGRNQPRPASALRAQLHQQHPNPTHSKARSSTDVGRVGPAKCPKDRIFSALAMAEQWPMGWSSPASPLCQCLASLLTCQSCQPMLLTQLRAGPCPAERTNENTISAHPPRPPSLPPPPPFLLMPSVAHPGVNMALPTQSSPSVQDRATERWGCHAPRCSCPPMMATRSPNLQRCRTRHDTVTSVSACTHMQRMVGEKGCRIMLPSA